MACGDPAARAPRRRPCHGPRRRRSRPLRSPRPPFRRGRPPHRAPAPPRLDRPGVGRRRPAPDRPRPAHPGRRRDGARTRTAPYGRDRHGPSGGTPLAPPSRSQPWSASSPPSPPPAPPPSASPTRSGSRSRRGERLRQGQRPARSGRECRRVLAAPWIPESRGGATTGASGWPEARSRRSASPVTRYHRSSGPRPRPPNRPGSGRCSANRTARRTPHRMVFGPVLLLAALATNTVFAWSSGRQARRLRHRPGAARGVTGTPVVSPCRPASGPRTPRTTSCRRRPCRVRR